MGKSTNDKNMNELQQCKKDLAGYQAKEKLFLISQENLASEQAKLAIDRTNLANQQRLLEEERATLSKLQVELTQKNKALIHQEQQLKKQELEAKNGFPSLAEEYFKEFHTKLAKREQACVNHEGELRAKETAIAQKELEIGRQQQRVDDDFAKERTTFTAKLTYELEKRRKEFDEALEKELIAFEKEKLIRREQLATELSKEREERFVALNAELDASRKALAQDQQQLHNDQVLLAQEKEELRMDRLKLEAGQESLETEQEQLNSRIDEGLGERKKEYEDEIASLKEYIDKLREDLKEQNKELQSYRMVEINFEGETFSREAIVRKFVQLQQENREQKEKIEQSFDEIQELRITLAEQSDYSKLKKQESEVTTLLERYQEESKKYYNNQVNFRELEQTKELLESEKEGLINHVNFLKAENNGLTIELQRAVASYAEQANREERIQVIERPYLYQEERPKMIQSNDEITWLNDILTQCEKHGFRFNSRILYAFHTALKTAEFSPLTVLAGVSGTGKSELPRLYALFGGISFLSVAVQPNWDSPESMLGFFNTIDNQFDAQPVLQLLAQSQKDQTEDYPGLKDSMTLILLDEMNLAHVEHYFSDFLSKLELRRGSRADEVPSLPIKLGAGIKPYNLPLGRNIMFAGTMNQDETTKALSDKVIDRGIMLYFPRPVKLIRRKKWISLPKNPSSLLPKNTWIRWLCSEIKFNDGENKTDSILPYRTLIDDINNALAPLGRALGHRVWQSIEYYMANYPTVKVEMDKDENERDIEKLKKAMKIAFEDQLVQKVMPKLQGIETRGKSKESLDTIQDLLKEYAIIEDFKRACEHDYGQFMWLSADYLMEKIEDNSHEENELTTLEDLIDEKDNEVKE